MIFLSRCLDRVKSWWKSRTFIKRFVLLVYTFCTLCVYSSSFSIRFCQKDIRVSESHRHVFFYWKKQLDQSGCLPSCVPNKLIVDGKHECKWCHLIMQISCLATFSPAPVRNQSYLHSQLCLWNLWKSISCHFSHYTISRLFRGMIIFTDLKEVNMVRFSSNSFLRMWIWAWLWTIRWFVIH